MNNKSFFKIYTDYEILKYQFENGIKTNKSYMLTNFDYSHYREKHNINEYNQSSNI